jgi:PPOX class probable F420-dependent enzyme
LDAVYERIFLAMVLSEEVRKALTSGRLAHLVTINEDGSPQVTIIWVGLDGDEIVSGHIGPKKKLRNVQRDPRVVISMEADGRTGILDNFLVIRGRARVTEGGAVELLDRLARVYLGPDAQFPVREAPESYVLHIEVEHVGGVGPWDKRHYSR